MSFDKRLVNRNKYHAQRQTYKGRSYHSRLEATHAYELDLLKKAAQKRDRVVEWTPQFKVDFYINGKFITRHYVDFLVKYADGRTELHEVKGFEKEEWIIKRRLLEFVWMPEHPEISKYVVYI